MNGKTFGVGGSSVAGAGMEAVPGENTRTVKTVKWTPPLGTAKCWGQFHLRKACLEVKTPEGKKAPRNGSAALGGPSFCEVVGGSGSRRITFRDPTGAPRSPETSITRNLFPTPCPSPILGRA